MYDYIRINRFLDVVEVREKGFLKALDLYAVKREMQKMGVDVFKVDSARLLDLLNADMDFCSSVKVTRF